MIMKGFLVLLVVAVVLGVGLGGAFAGGVALGKSQEQRAAGSKPAASSASSLQQPSGQLSQGQTAQSQQRSRSGQSVQQDPNQPGPQSQNQSSGSGGGQGFGGRAPLVGTIEKVEGNTVTINTPQGPIHATVGTDTTIQRFATSILADLQKGANVTVLDQRAADGSVQARAILLTLEGAESFFSGSGPRSGQQPP